LKRPEDVALLYVDRINEGNLEGLLELMPEDYAFVDVDGTIERGRDLMRKGWSEYFKEFPDYKIHLSRVIPLGDVVVLIGRTAGSQIPPGVEAEETVIWTAWVRDGLVKEWRIVYADTEKARRLVGAEGQSA
jgi:ketosteroid isomerase-like protein